MSIFDVAARSTVEIIKPKFETEPFNDRLRARDFVWQYAKTFCVYCPLTQNLYVDYDFFNTAGERNVVVLPKNDYLSTFPRISHDFIRPTPLMFVPNGKLSKAFVFDRLNKGGSRPAADTLLRLANDSGLLPVIIKSDLKRLKSDVPFLMLRMIHVDRVNSLSRFSQCQIKAAIVEKLDHCASLWRR